VFKILQTLTAQALTWRTPKVTLMCGALLDEYTAGQDSEHDIYTNGVQHINLLKPSYRFT
jgi:hypothetical protein